MASLHRPSLLSLLILTLLLVVASASVSMQYEDPKAKHDYYLNELGVEGVNYNMDDGVPYILCHVFNDNSTSSPDCMSPNDPESCAADHKCRFEDPKRELNMVGKRLGCYALYKVKDMDRLDFLPKNTPLSPNDVESVKSTCWHGQPEIHSQCHLTDKCVGTTKMVRASGGFLFCCCTIHGCNAQVQIVSDIEEEEKVVSGLAVFLFVLGIILLITIGALTLHRYKKCIIRRIKKPSKYSYEGSVKMTLVKGDDTTSECPTDITLLSSHEKKLDNVIELQKEVARGRYGVVYRGTMKRPTGDIEVAVKVFKKAFEKMWQAEREMLSVDGIFCHQSIIHFHGSLTMSAVDELWLVLDYHEKGSLERYLKDAILKPELSLTMARSFLEGLAYLHEEMNLPSGRYKPTVVHRDLKSRNLLVNRNDTLIITDFNLAMVYSTMSQPARQSQVGTPRYMAPELLEGSTSLTIEAFTKADVYSAALVLWEILNRTQANDQDEMMPASLPYEEEMQEALLTREGCARRLQDLLKKRVAYGGKRPPLRDQLLSNPITSLLARTTIEMWEPEVEARLTAECANVRLHGMMGDASPPSLSPPHP